MGALSNAGANVRGLSGLHAKVFVFGTARAVVTSVNLTEAALARNAEFGCISDDPEFVAECSAYVTGLHDVSATLIPDDLARWQEAVDDCLRRAGRDPIGSLPDHGAGRQPAAPPITIAPAVETVEVRIARRHAMPGLAEPLLSSTNDHVPRRRRGFASGAR
jgi:hypothetical protein